MNRKFLITATIRNKKGRILAVATNNYNKSHPKMLEYGKRINNHHLMFLHAEVAAIIKAMRVGIPYSIFIERYDNNGNPRLAKPCPACELAIKEAGIKIVSYTVG